MSVVTNKYNIGDVVFYLGEKSIFSGVVQYINNMEGNNFNYISYMVSGAHGETLKDDELYSSYSNAAQQQIKDILIEAEGDIRAAYYRMENSEMGNIKKELIKLSIDREVANIYTILDE